jgi:hypothetical protein
MSHKSNGLSRGKKSEVCGISLGGKPQLEVVGVGGWLVLRLEFQLLVLRQGC